jgi:hypothetical protein
MARELVDALRLAPHAAAAACDAVLAGLSPPDALEIAYATRLLLYLSSNELHAARFLWRSAPPTIAKAPEVARAWKVGAALFAGDLASAAVSLGAPWSVPVQPFAASVLPLQREVIAGALAKSYSSISPESFGSALVMAPASARQCEYKEEYQVKRRNSSPHFSSAYRRAGAWVDTDGHVAGSTRWSGRRRCIPWRSHGCAC